MDTSKNQKMSDRTEFFIPQGVEGFESLLGGISLRKSMHKMAELNSGSKTSDEQFGLLRAFFPRRKPCEMFEADLQIYGLAKNASGNEYWKEADNLLRQCKSYQKFLAAIWSRTKADDVDKNGNSWTGEFTTARERRGRQVLGLFLQ